MRIFNTHKAVTAFRDIPMEKKTFQIEVRRCRGKKNPVRNVCFVKKKNGYIVTATAHATNSQITDGVRAMHKRRFNSTKNADFVISADLSIEDVRKDAREKQRISRTSTEVVKLSEKVKSYFKQRDLEEKGKKIFESMPKKLHTVLPATNQKFDQDGPKDMEVFGAPSNEADKRRANRERVSFGAKKRPEAFDKWTQTHVVFTRMKNG